MKTINSMEEYLYLVDETLFDAGDLMMMLRGPEESGAEADGDADADTDMGYASTLEAQISMLQQSIADGSYAFVDQDLPFMAVLHANREQIPFADSLALINRTHRNGFGGGD